MARAEKTGPTANDPKRGAAPDLSPDVTAELLGAVITISADGTIRS